MHNLSVRDTKFPDAFDDLHAEGPSGWLRVKLAIASIAARFWALLPRSWLPGAYWICFSFAACLPARLQLRARSFVGRLRAEHAGIEHDYPTWIRLYEQRGKKVRRAIMAHIAQFDDPPLISVVMPVFNPLPDHLRATIKSVQDQIYTRWELCIAEDLSTAASITALLREVQAKDSRIKVVWKDTSGNIAATSNSALRLATGSFIARLDDDDLIAPRALYEVAARVVAQPKIDIVYSDEDRIDDAGRRSEPHFKPDWNPELMLGMNLISNLGVYRRSLVERLDGFRAGLEGSQDYDLALRATAETAPDRIVHIAKVLYHRRRDDSGPVVSEAAVNDCAISGRRAVSEFLSRGFPDAQVEPAPSVPAWSRVIYPVPHPEPLVSVVIPSRNHAKMLVRTMDGLLGRTDYPALEVLIVDNGSDQPAALELLENLAQDARVRVLRCPGPFNYSALNNRGVREAAGSLILLLNNDIDVIKPDWLREMVSHAVRPGIGAVGAKLLYPDGTIQHGGVTIGMFGLAGHQYLNKPRGDPGYFGHLKLVRNVTAVTAACLLLRRDVYWEVGGLNEVSLPVAFNDVDLCLKLVERGYRNLWTPHAELYHLESASRGSDNTPEKVARLKRDIAYMRERWGHMLDSDPHWNPNLSLHSPEVALAFPPRDVFAPAREAA